MDAKGDMLLKQTDSRHLTASFTPVQIGDALLNSSPNGIFCFDHDVRYTVWNPKMEEISKLKTKEMIGRRFEDLFPFTGEKGKEDRLGSVLTGETFISLNQRSLFPNGSSNRVYDIHYFPLRDEFDCVVGGAGMVVDVTERCEAEQELGRFKFISDNSIDAHYLIDDDDGHILYVNRVACEKLGYAESEFLSMTSRELVAYWDEEKARTIKALTAGEKISAFEAVHKRRDGSLLPVEVSITVVEFFGRKYRFAVARDISERKKADNELKRQAAELARSNNELQQFAYVASHDLTEPLRMVTSYLQLLSKRYQGKLDTDANDFIWYAIDGANRMYTLINDLLAYSHVGTHNEPPCPTSFSKILGSAVANLRAMVQETRANIIPKALPTLVVDESQMVQLFQNLIGNAIKFRGKQPPVIRVEAEKGHGEWIFSILDNGIGVSPEYLTRIFIIFQRLHTRESYPGNGIGLAICKKIVERHGGRIWVESTPGEGSVFRFTIPIHSR